MEELQGILAQLAQFVEDAAPHVWAIAIKQVYVVAWQYLIAAGLLFGLTVALYKVGRWDFDRQSDDYMKDLDLMAAAIGIGIVAVAVAAPLVIMAVARFVNPEFYAIKILLDLAQ